jgi:hypothetical protein
MKVNTKSYPHPVLGNEDDLGGFFKVDFHYELSREEVALNPVFALQNSAIENLMKNNKASFVVEVQCRSTFFRTSFSTKKLIERFIIPSRLVRERVIVGFYICADQNINGYAPSDPHPDYNEIRFDVEKGDVLAIGGFCSFIAEKDFDPLRPPVSSFMSIVVGNHHEGPMQIDYESQKIQIILSKADWKSYLSVRSQKAAVGILHSAIVFPALIDAIYQITNGTGDYEDKNWYGRLEAILEAKSLRDKDPFESAQKILENPANRSFQGISSLLEVTNGQEYD